MPVLCGAKNVDEIKERGIRRRLEVARWPPNLRSNRTDICLVPRQNRVLAPIAAYRPFGFLDCSFPPAAVFACHGQCSARSRSTPSQALYRCPPRERLIESARTLFCRYGINSVGVDAIIESGRNRQDHALQVVRLEGRSGRSRARPRRPQLAQLVSDLDRRTGRQRARAVGRASAPRSRSGSAATISSAARSSMRSANPTRPTTGCAPWRSRTRPSCSIV